MNLISPDSAGLYYDKIFALKNSNADLFSKITRYRLILESFFRELTKNEKQAFSGVFSRILYVTEKYNTSNEINNLIHGFRKFANTIVHSDNYHSINALEDELKCIKALSEIINCFSGTAIPDEIIYLYKNSGVPGFEEVKKSLRKKILFLRTVVLNVSDEKKTSTGMSFFTVKLESEDETEQFFLNIYPPFLYLKSALKYLSNLNIFNVIQTKNNIDLYNTAQDTLLILEPDYLLEARAVAECFQLRGSTHLLYFIDKFISNDSSPFMLKGNIVNNILDIFTVNPKSDFDEEFDNSYDVLQSLKLTKNELGEIKKEIKTLHLNNIKHFSGYVKNKNKIIEPTFIAPEFGLQGRLDVMLESGINDKEIVELKSGSFPNYDTWLNHKMQVIAYNLIIDSVFKNRLGSSSIFYSKAAKNYLRNVPKDKTLYNNLLNLRNRIVDAELKLSQKDYSVLNELIKFNNKDYPSFIISKFSEFAAVIKNSSETEKLYFKYFTSFVTNELKTAKTGTDKYYEGAYNGFASLWLESFLDKEENSGILDNLTYDKYSAKKDEYRFNRIVPDGITNFREGDIGIIYPKNPSAPSPVKSQILKCTITNITKEKVHIKLRNKQVKENIFSGETLWAIEHDIFEANYKNQTQSLFTFLKADKKRKELLLCKIKPETIKKNFRHPGLNENLNRIISKSKCAKDYFILQGPPGTGKTSVALMLMVAEAIKDNPGSDITILAYTNRAVDEICNNLRKGISYINNENIKSVMRNYLRLGSDNVDDENLFQNLPENKNPEVIKKLIKEKRIIVSTVHSFLGKHKDLEHLKNFDIVFVDEASQIVEPQLIGILAKCKKFILIGDHLQLPAVVLQDEKYCTVEEKLLNAAGIYSLGNSLFERFFTHCIKKGWKDSCDTLETHYRMHSDIADLIRGNYQVSLFSGNESQSSSQKLFNINSPDNIEKILAASRVLFFPSRVIKENKYNSEEADRVNLLLERIKKGYGKKFNEKCVGVITPWRMQISKIKNSINDEEIIDKVTVDTVERFQGSERDIIIISLAVYNRAQIANLQSLNLDKTVDRKLNVALSRAKEHLIILGCEEVLSCSPHYSRVIEIIKEKNGYVTQF
ncbi:MAG: ATP-dependent helicase [Ignavibacteria bacterium]|nr:ATP-dependent helicase [Ignavibacteria bacterium]